MEIVNLILKEINKTKVKNTMMMLFSIRSFIQFDNNNLSFPMQTNDVKKTLKERNYAMPKMLTLGPGHLQPIFSSVLFIYCGKLVHVFVYCRVWVPFYTPMNGVSFQLIDDCLKSRVRVRFSQLSRTQKLDIITNNDCVWNCEHFEQINRLIEMIRFIIVRAQTENQN